MREGGNEDDADAGRVAGGKGGSNVQVKGLEPPGGGGLSMWWPVGCRKARGGCVSQRLACCSKERDAGAGLSPPPLGCPSERSASEDEPYGRRVTGDSASIVAC